MENTYWNGEGKYQNFSEELDEKAPGHGYTSNVFMNLYLTMAHLYYDAYNNGGGNIEDCYADYFKRNVAPYLPEIRIGPFITCDYPVMEQMMDKTLEFLRDKPLDFPVYTVWLNGKGDAFSHIEPIFPESEAAGWRPVTFGMEDDLDEWCSIRSLTDRDASFEIAAKNKEFREHALPPMCYSTLKSTGDLICIKNGQEGYYQTEYSSKDPAENAVKAAQLNKQLGVSDAQLKAMEFGSMFGWDKPGARPEVYFKKSLDEQILGAQEKKPDLTTEPRTSVQEQSLQQEGLTL